MMTCSQYRGTHAAGLLTGGANHHKQSREQLQRFSHAAQTPSPQTEQIKLSSGAVWVHSPASSSICDGMIRPIPPASLRLQQ
jgi:hypothetical protein